MIVTRFAPSPTGELHVGHAASALLAFEKARAAGGSFLLRIEDIDPGRCRLPFIEQIYDDLHWLGLSWPVPVRRQAQHLDDYARAFECLRGRGLLYPCYCTRKEIESEAVASASAPQEGAGSEGPLYPGTCKHLTETEREALAATRAPVWRLDSAKALASVGPLFWEEEGKGRIEAHPELFGDVVLARKDVPTSYHLSVTVDDALQGVTLVTRGEDLFAATAVHVLLQKLLDLPTPRYLHHPLARDAQGRRFAKRDKGATLRSLREAGVSPEDVRRRAYALIGLSAANKES